MIDLSTKGELERQFRYQSGRWYDLDPIAALQGTNQRFIQRLMQMETVADRPLSDSSLEELEQLLWQQPKARLKQRED